MGVDQVQRSYLLFAVLFLTISFAPAQDSSMPGMPGMEQKQEAKPLAQSPPAKPKATDAPQHPGHDMQNMSGMDISKNEELPTHLMSGTHLEPASIPAPMWMKHNGP